MHWFTASERVDEHLATDGTLVRRYRVRHRPIVGWFTRFFGHYLVDAARHLGAYMSAAGGRIGRLDLTGTVTKANTEANTEAIARHRAGRRHVVSTTPIARPWEYFVAQHHQHPTKLSLDDARRRFEAQPRVLAMLAYAGPHSFDPYELEAYQAGEATYAAVHWKTALAGHALITAEGKLLQPAGHSLADRLRYPDAGSADGPAAEC